MGLPDRGRHGEDEEGRPCVRWRGSGGAPLLLLGRALRCCCALEPERSTDSVLCTDGERCRRSASTVGRSASAAALEPGRSLGAALHADGVRNREKEPTGT